MKTILAYFQKRRLAKSQNSAIFNGYVKQVNSKEELKDHLIIALRKKKAKGDTTPVIVVEPKTLKKIKIQLEGGKFTTTIKED